MPFVQEYREKPAMAPAKPLKEQLFDLFTANLAALGQHIDGFPVPPDTYLCPCCHRRFGRETLSDPDALTIEHSIPESLGGTRETATLTCKRCNNEAGRLFDAHLGKKLNADDFLQGISDVPHRAWFEVGEGRTQADVHFDGEARAFQVYFCQHVKDAPDSREAVRAVMEGIGRGDLEFQFQMRFNYLPRNARIGLMRIAFLMLFRHFGYAYALSAGGNFARRLIMNPEIETVPEVVAFYLEQGREHCNTAGVITGPSERRGFIVPLRLSTKSRDVYKGVVMPATWDEDGEIYRSMAREKQDGKGFSAR
jgi:HNH endonuclease